MFFKGDSHRIVLDWFSRKEGQGLGVACGVGVFTWLNTTWHRGDWGYREVRTAKGCWGLNSSTRQDLVLDHGQLSGMEDPSTRRVLEGRAYTGSRYIYTTKAARQDPDLAGASRHGLGSLTPRDTQPRSSPQRSKHLGHQHLKS